MILAGSYAPSIRPTTLHQRATVRAAKKGLFHPVFSWLFRYDFIPVGVAQRPEPRKKTQRYRGLWRIAPGKAPTGILLTHKTTLHCLFTGVFRVAAQVIKHARIAPRRVCDYSGIRGINHLPTNMNTYVAVVMVINIFASHVRVTRAFGEPSTAPNPPPPPFPRALV